MEIREKSKIKRERRKKNKIKERNYEIGSDLDDIMRVYDFNVIDFIVRKFDIHQRVQSWRWRHFNNRTWH